MKRRSPNKYTLNGDIAYCNKPLSPEAKAELATLKPTRQQRRLAGFQREYQRLGIGLHTRPQFNEPRRIMRAIARSIAKRADVRRASER